MMRNATRRPLTESPRPCRTRRRWDGVRPRAKARASCWRGNPARGDQADWLGALVAAPGRPPRPRQAAGGARAGPDRERFDVGSFTTLAAATLAVVSAFYLPPALLELVQAAVRVVEGAR